MQSVRSLTVGRLSRRCYIDLSTRDMYGDVVYDKMKAVDCSCPLLRLSGHWLAEAGFEMGAKVKVEVSKGQLVIKLKGGSES